MDCRQERQQEDQLGGSYEVLAMEMGKRSEQILEVE